MATLVKLFKILYKYNIKRGKNIRRSFKLGSEEKKHELFEGFTR